MRNCEQFGAMAASPLRGSASSQEPAQSATRASVSEQLMQSQTVKEIQAAFEEFRSQRAAVDAILAKVWRFLLTGSIHLYAYNYPTNLYKYRKRKTPAWRSGRSASTMRS